MNPAVILAIIAASFIIYGIVIITSYYKLQEDLREHQNYVSQKMVDIRSYISSIKCTCLNDNINMKEALLKMVKRLDKFERQYKTGASILDKPSKKNKKT